MQEKPFTLIKNNMHRKVNAWVIYKTESGGELKICYAEDYPKDFSEGRLKGSKAAVYLKQKGMSFVKMVLLDFDMVVQPNPFEFIYYQKDIPGLIKQLENAEAVMQEIQQIVNEYFPEDKRILLEMPEEV